MKRLIATGMAGAVLAGVLSAGVAQAKPVFTSLIGGAGLRQAEQAPEWEIPTEAVMKYKAAKKKFVGFVDLGDLPVNASESDEDEALICLEERNVALQKQVAIRNRRGRITGHKWEAKGRTTTDLEGFFEFGPYRRAPSGKWRAAVARHAFTNAYGVLISCTAATSRPVNV